MTKPAKPGTFDGTKYTPLTMTAPIAVLPKLMPIEKPTHNPPIEDVRASRASSLSDESFADDGSTEAVSQVDETFSEHETASVKDEPKTMKPIVDDEEEHPQKVEPTSMSIAERRKLFSGASKTPLKKVVVAPAPVVMAPPPPVVAPVATVEPTTMMEASRTAVRALEKKMDKPSAVLPTEKEEPTMAKKPSAVRAAEQPKTTIEKKVKPTLGEIQLKPVGDREKKMMIEKHETGCPKINLRHVDRPRSQKIIVKKDEMTREEKLKAHKEERERRLSTETEASPRAKEDDVATVIEAHDAETHDELSVHVGDVVTVKLSKGGWSFCAEETTWVLVQKGTEQGLVPSKKLGLGKMHLKSGKGRGGGAMDRQLAAKAAAKYDPMAEALAQHWIEQTTGHVFRHPFAEELQDGTVLCKLANTISPDSVRRIYDGKVQYLQMDNIENFLKAVTSFGVPRSDQFETVDLYECRDLNLVVNCLFALSQHIMKHPDDFPDFGGPFLKPANDTDPAVLSSLKLIVAVNDYRDRNWHQNHEDDDDGAETTTTEEPAEEKTVRDAIEYRLAMLGLREKQKEDPDCRAHAVDRNEFEESFLVLYSSSTKHERHIEYEERRIADLLAAKKRRYELVYIDVAPERKAQLYEVAGQDVKLPALVFGDEYYGDLSVLQEYEDAEALDDLLEPAQEGTGFWALPDSWSKTSSCLDGGGFKIVNDIP